MQQTLEAIVIDIVLELSKQPADQIPYEHHLGLERTQLLRRHIFQVRLIRYEKRRLPCVLVSACGHRRGRCMRTASLLDEFSLLRKRDEDLLCGRLRNCALEVRGDVDGAERAVHLRPSVRQRVRTSSQRLGYERDTSKQREDVRVGGTRGSSLRL